MNAKPEYFFWGTGANGAYGDGIPVPRVTYRCKGKTKVTKKAGNAVKQPVTHECKLETDHESIGPCICICGQKFNEKEAANV